MELNRVRDVIDRVPIRTVLVSAADKTALLETITALASLVEGLVVYATGGSLNALGPVADRCALHGVTELTGQPELQGGLVKTIDYTIALALLAESDNPAHRADLERTGTPPVDLVVCNLYPFRTVRDTAGSDLEDLRAHIDIGGVTLVRAAAKNFLRVAVLTDPAQYAPFLDRVRSGAGTLTLRRRFDYAKAALGEIARYDADIDAALRGASLAAYTVARS